MTAYATPSKRFAGFVVDFVIMFGVMLVLIPVTGGIDLDAIAAGEPLPRDLVGAAFALVTAYHVVFVAMRGQTLGKMVAKTKVVRDRSGELPSWWQAIIRWFVPGIAGSLPGVLSVLWVAVYLWILLDHRNQGIHDKAARTIVIDLDEA